MSQVNGFSSIPWLVILLFISNPLVISHLEHGCFILAQTVGSLKIDNTLHSLGWGGQLSQREHQTLNKRKFKCECITKPLMLLNVVLSRIFHSSWRVGEGESKLSHMNVLLVHPTLRKLLKQKWNNMQPIRHSFQLMCQNN